MPIVTEEFLTFLADLAENNNRDWFNANKSRFETVVKEQFLKLVGELQGRLIKYEPQLEHAPTNKMIFRIYRDVRFSKDKNPYKDHVSALISEFGTKDKGTPSHYLQISAHELMIAGGVYFVENKDLLHQIRIFIQENADEFSKLIADKSFLKCFGGVQGIKNKRLPKEFTGFAATQPLIANTQFYWTAMLNSQMLLKEDAVDTLAGILISARHLQEFFRRALKPGK